jgi:hypothetical protein
MVDRDLEIGRRRSLVAAARIPSRQARTKSERLKARTTSLTVTAWS